MVNIYTFNSLKRNCWLKWCMHIFYMLDELCSITNVSKLSSIENTNLHFHQQRMNVIMQTFKDSTPFTLVLSTKSMCWEHIQMTSSLTCCHSWGAVIEETDLVSDLCNSLQMFHLVEKMPQFFCQIFSWNCMIVGYNTTQSLVDLMVPLLFYSINWHKTVHWY